MGAALELQLHSEKTKVAELGRRCIDLEVKAGTFENVVCVLNREVERFATTMEASNRQHRLDQDKIEALSNKVYILGVGITGYLTIRYARDTDNIAIQRF